MTLYELSQQIKLREMLERDKEILEALQAAVYPQGSTGMPRAPGVKDKVGDLAIEIADIKERIRYLEEEIAAKEVEVCTFIDTIGDDRLRVIFRLRFIRCLTWQQTADIMGVDGGEESVRKMCYRYLGRP